MKILSTTLICIGTLLLLTGCATNRLQHNAMAGLNAPYKPPPGFLFSQVKAPLSIDYNNTQVTGLKEGQAIGHYVFIPLAGILTVAWGDSSLEEAARNGRISQLEYADYEEFNVLGIYRRSTVFAHGN